MTFRIIHFRNLLSLIFCSFLFIHCGGDEGSSSSLSSSEQTAVSTAIVSALEDGNTDFNTKTNNSKFVSFDVIADSIAFTSVYNCPIGGHITSTGNIVVTVDTEDMSSTTFGTISMAVSDATNNLNDCEVLDDIILDGSLVLTFSGNSAEGVGLSLTGTIDIDRRGSGGGLVLIESCFVILNVAKGSTTVTGSVCGEAV
jgi:hypothetical protein